MTQNKTDGKRFAALNIMPASKLRHANITIMANMLILAIVCVPAVLGGLSFLFSAKIILAIALSCCRVVVPRLVETSSTINHSHAQIGSAAGVLSVGSGSIKPPKGYAHEFPCSWYLTSKELRIFQTGLSRILIGLLAYVALLSLALALSTFMVPSDFEGAYSEYSKGTTETCRFQGFLFQSGSTGSTLYMVFLSNYYVIAIKTASKLRREANGDMNTATEQEAISACHPVKYLELFGHMIANMSAISSSLYFLLNDRISPVNGGQYCYVSRIQSYLPYIVILSVFVASTVVNFIILLFHKMRKGENAAIGSLKKQQDRLSQYAEVSSPQGATEKNTNTKKKIAKQTFVSRKLEKRTIGKSEEITPKIIEPSSKIFKIPTNDPLAFDVRQMKKKIQIDSVIKSQKDSRTSKNSSIYLGDGDKEEGAHSSHSSSFESPFLLDPNELFVSNSPPRSRYGTDTDPYHFNVSRAKQDSSLSGILNDHTNDSRVAIETKYDICDSSQALLFMSVFLFCSLTFLVLNILYRVTDVTVPYCLVLFSNILNSMQGILLSLVCLRPTMILLKKENPEHSCGRIFFQAISQIGGIGKDSLQNSQQMFPIPNPMDLDDEERNELNASISKQFREYKKRMSAAKFEIDIGLLGEIREEETKKEVSP